MRRATAVLISSLTGRPFYARNGYVADGEPQAKFGLRDVFPMSKRLLT